MKKRFIAIFISVALILSLLVPSLVFSSTTSNIYYDGLVVGLESMMSEIVSVELKGNYVVNGQALPDKTKFILKITDNKIEFDGKLVDTVVIEPQNEENYIILTLLNQSLVPGTKRNYQGKLQFKIKNNKLLGLNTIDMERYLLGVVPYEVSDSWPLEALKSQAVAARSYAFNKISLNSDGYNICDTTHCQVYKGFDSSYINSKKAVEETKGQVLVYNGQVIQAFFHASNGGYTEKSENVWTSSLPYFQTKKDDFSVTNWPAGDKTFTTIQIENALKSKGYISQSDSLIRLDLNTIEFYESGRVKNIQAIVMQTTGQPKVINLPKERLKAALGLQSNLYTITYNEGEDKYLFSGKGYGHGIGLSQIGARNRANAGYSYMDILNFYYPNTIVDKLTASIDSVSLSRAAIYVNDNLTATVNAKSKGNVIYKYEVIKDNKVVFTENDTSSNIFVYQPLTEGTYILKVYVKDSRSNVYEDYKEVSFKAVYPQVSRGGNEVALNTFRIYGDNRLKTAIAVSQTGWNSADYAVIARADDFPDALSAGPLAKKYDAPILLTSMDRLDVNVENELLRLGVKNVFIIGSEGAISKDVENKIKSLSISVERIGGNDRIETSINIAKKLGVNFKEVFVTTGWNYPDALSISSIAAIKNAPIILTSPDKPSNIVIDYLSYDELEKVYVIGGDKVVSNKALPNLLEKVERVSGEDRYQTNIEVAKKFNNLISPDKVFIATGQNFPDALSGSSLAAKNNSIIILSSNVEKDYMVNYVNSKFKNTTLKFILGGNNVVSNDMFFKIFK